MAESGLDPIGVTFSSLSCPTIATRVPGYRGIAVADLAGGIGMRVATSLAEHIPETEHGAPMLSYLYRLIQGFKRQHGRQPNFVYMNERHYRQLIDSLPGMKSEAEIARFLAMEIVISSGLLHPDVALVTSTPRTALIA
jgi:hypothetical protein